MTSERKQIRRACAWLLLIGLYASPAAAAETPEVDYRPDIVYGTGAGEELKLDLASPKNLASSLPALVLIHGGGWAAGDKHDFADLARRAAGAGYVAVTINYRHAPKHLFPAQIEDAKCAVRWLRAKAGELHVDPARIGALGGSAGAHLAMMLGTMDSADGLEGGGGWADQSSKVQAVVSFVGPTNLLGDMPDVSKGIVANFLGGPRDEKQDQSRLASPVTYVNSGDAPTLMFHGTKDPLIPNDQAFVMAEKLTEAGVPGRVELLLGRGHGWGKDEMDRTLAESFSFFDKLLKKP